MILSVGSVSVDPMFQERTVMPVLQPPTCSDPQDVELVTVIRWALRTFSATPAMDSVCVCLEHLGANVATVNPTIGATLLASPAPVMETVNSVTLSQANV